jgi:anaerobic selenocysteine-containing dehydrogenase
MIPSAPAMHSVCPHDCPSVCALVVTVADGRLTGVTGDPTHPFTQGVICGKVRAYAERVHSSLRVLQPLRRVGPKGADGFKPIAWDEAVEEIARRWRTIVAEYGGEAILPFSYAGTMGVRSPTNGWRLPSRRPTSTTRIRRPSARTRPSCCASSRGRIFTVVHASR